MKSKFNQRFFIGVGFVVLLLIGVFCFFNYKFTTNSQVTGNLNIDDFKLDDNVKILNRDNLLNQGELQLIDGELANGQYVEYSEDSNTVVAIFNFKNGKLDGHNFAFYENGKIHQESHYTEGKLDGSVITYFENGNIQAKTDYKNGKVDGEWVNYNEDGSIIYKGTYKDGELITSE